MFNKLKKYFHKPEIEFNKPLTSADVVKMFKDKNFYQLRKLMPQINFGRKKLSRWQSLGLVAMGVLGVALLPLHPLLALMALSISFGSEYVFNSGATYYNSVIVLDSTHFVVTYDDGSNNDYGTAIVGTVSGTTISFGSEYVFNSAESNYNSTAALDSTHFVVSYQDHGNSDYGTAIVGTVSGTTISYGSEYVFNSGSSNSMGVITLDSTHFVVAYADGANGNHGTAIVGTVSGTTISYGSEYVFNSGSTDYVSTAALDSTHFVVAYDDGGNSNYGTAIHGTYSPPVVAPTVTTQAVTNIGTDSATGNGNVTDDGGDSNASRGMCWNTSGTPTTSDSHATNGTGEGAYTVSMTSLVAGTTYYVRAYSINSAGTSYGGQVSFTTKTSGSGLFFGTNF